MNTVKKKRSRYDNVAYLFILPNYLILIVFLIIPILRTIQLSFCSYDLVQSSFVGLANYTALLKDTVFRRSLFNTLVYSLCTIPIAMALGLLLALALNKLSYIRSFFRTVFFLPHILSIVAVSMAWLYMYDTNAGILNRLLKLVGMRSVPWLTDTSYALLSVCVVGIWATCGYNMLIFLSGLQAIPDYLYEAARIDGATPVHQFVHITLPMLSQTTFFIFIMACINSFQVFGQVYILTNGGPSNSTTTIAHQIYKNGFELYNMGYASAMAVVLMAAILLITLVNMKLNPRGMEADI